MSFWKSVLFLALGSFLTSGLIAGEAPTPEELVRRLGADDFDQRQEAAEKLEMLGETARTALEKARQSDVLEVRATAQRLLARLKAAQLLVQIVDESGQPWPKLSVTGGLSWNGGSAEREQVSFAAARALNKREALETDEKGFLKLESTRSGQHSLFLMISEANWARNYWQPQALDLYSGMNGALWIQPRGAVVKGKVVSAKTGEPIADAEVLVRRDDNATSEAILNYWAVGQRMPFQNTGSADAKGEFSIAGVSPASLKIYARHQDYAPAAGPALIVTEKGEYVVGEPIFLQPKALAWGRVRVQVLNDEGQPAKVTKVQLQLIPTGTGGDDQGLLAFGGRWQRRFQNHDRVALETNNEGWVESELMEPGAYRLVVQPGDPAQGRDDAASRVEHGEIQVKAGETVVVAGRKAPKNGRLTGRFKSAEEDQGRQPIRLFALRVDDPLVKEWLARPNTIQPWLLGQLADQNRSAQYIQSVRDPFEIRNLLPGRYVLIAHSMQDNRMGWVFGVDVKEDAETAIPEIELAGAGGPKAAAKPRILSGVLLGENGKAIDGGATWMLKGRNFNNSSTTGGRFRINLQENMLPETLTFSCPGYRPHTIDLRKPLADPNNLTVQLQRQRYGAVQVLVRDADGKPLEDVQVAPVSAVRHMPSLERARETGADGAAKLNGLACGSRQIMAFLDNYYLEESAKIDVAADETKELSLVLKPGKTVKGRVVVPAGMDAASVLVWFAKVEEGQGGAQEFWRSTGVNERGEFTFPGLAPGQGKLRAQAPGFLSEERKVTAGTEELVELRLSKPVNLVVDLGDAAKGGSVCLAKTASWNPLAGGSFALFNFNSRVPLDANGKAVIGGVTPGAYDLLFLLDKNKNLNGMQTGEPALFQIIPVRIEDGQAPPVTKIAWKSGTATLKMARERSENEELQPNGWSGMLLLEGKEAFAFISMVHQPGMTVQKPWFIKGTPPEGFLEQVESQGIRVAHLPAGEYKLHRFRGNPWMVRSVRMQFQDGRPALPKTFTLLKSFTLKDGETLDLGPLKMETPDEANAGESSGEEIGEDQPLR